MAGLLARLGRSFGRSTETSPARDPASLDLLLAEAAVHQSVGRAADAVAVLTTALHSFPDSDAAYVALGIAEISRGNRAGAGWAFQRATEVNGSNADAHNNLGNVALEDGDVGRAERCFARAVKLRPELAQFAVNLALVQQRRGAADEALRTLASLLERKPDDAAALNNIAALHIASGRLSEAEGCLRRCVSIVPDMPEAWRNLADVLAATGRPGEAIVCCEKALALRADWVDALALLARLLARENDTRAEAYARRALTLAPANANAHMALASVMTARCALDDAERALRDANRLAPASATARYNLANVLLLKGEYAEGFDLYESRFDAFATARPVVTAFERMLGHERRWKGEPCVGRSLLLWTEQGYGDCIMMLRYVELLRQRGVARILAVCPPALRRVVAALPGIDRMLGDDEDLTGIDYDLHCPLLSLPLAFATQFSSVPANIPYITPLSQDVERWRSRIARFAGTKVGLVWAGAQSLEADARRSVPFEFFAPFLDVDGVRCFSLQKQDGARSLRAEHPQVVDWMADCADFADTAALVANLDLVIAVDTAVAHLAAATGKPVWLLCRHESEWRWGTHGERTPWYPTVRIYRQPAPNAWRPVIERIRADLQLFVRARQDFLQNAGARP